MTKDILAARKAIDKVFNRAASDSFPLPIADYKATILQAIMEALPPKMERMNSRPPEVTEAMQRDYNKGVTAWNAHSDEVTSILQQILGDT